MTAADFSAATPDTIQMIATAGAMLQIVAVTQREPSRIHAYARLRGGCEATDLAILATPSVAIGGAPGLCCEPIVDLTSAFLRRAGAAVLVFLARVFSSALEAQQSDSAQPIVVQPDAPGKPSRALPPSTKGTLPPLSQADVEFMQGMIMHHAQAVEMTALVTSHTENKELRSLGARISRSQSEEIRFMRRWLAARGEPISMAGSSSSGSPGRASPGTVSSAPTTGGMAGMNGPGMSDRSHGSMGLMPGMLKPEQMEALRKAGGAEFDRLFLTGMIQHHNGALVMVKDLFDTAGAGQDAELFNFATDVDTGQRAEIRIMQGLLDKTSPRGTKEERR